MRAAASTTGREFFTIVTPLMGARTYYGEEKAIFASLG
jgi:hypothetical protein